MKGYQIITHTQRIWSLHDGMLHKKAGHMYLFHLTAN